MPPAGPAPAIAARLEAGLFVAPVRLDSTGRVSRFLFSTGMNVTAIDSALAARLALERVTSPEPATDAAGRTARVTLVRLPRLSMAGLAARDVRAAAIDLSGLRASVGLAIDGIVGANVLRETPYTVDYQRGEVRWGAPDTLAGDAVVLPLLVDTTSVIPPLVPLKVQAAELWAAIDCGALGGLYVPRRILEDLRLPPDRLVRCRGALGTGPPILAARVPALTLGSLRLDDVPVESTESGFALIGAEFLRHFRVSVDHARRRVVLVPVGARWEHDVRSFGLGLAAAGAAGAVVTGVWEGSPADRAGLRPGQRVLRVDGRPAESLSIPALRARLHAAAVRSIELVVLADSTVRTVTLRKSARFATPPAPR